MPVSGTACARTLPGSVSVGKRPCGAMSTPPSFMPPAISLRELERVGAHVLGAVLNRTQTFIPEFLTRLTNPQDVVEIAVIPQEGNR